MGTYSVLFVIFVTVFFVSWIYILPSYAEGNLRLPHIFSDNMVIQRDSEIPIWGWAEEGSKVTVQFDGDKGIAQADSGGKWIVRLPAKSVGGPYEMIVASGDTIVIKNILIGDVWLCSGQSNMQWGVASSLNAQEEIESAKYPEIRLFNVPNVTSGMPSPDVNASWAVCSPETVSGFSAVGYFFGRELHNELKVPIGLINSSWGGTRIEPWTPIEGFALVPELEDIKTRIEQTNIDFRKQLKEHLDSVEEWLVKTRNALDEGKAIQPLEVIRHPLNNNWDPTGIYNAMIHPVVPFPIRGAIWYQGESNRGDGMLYYYKMKALIGGWRKVWNIGDFPFYFVQLAPFRYDNSPFDIPKIWEAQTRSLEITNTGMVVTIDIGNLSDIHPQNKQDVGKRLALCALHGTYRLKDIVFSGPMFKEMAIQNDKAVITFKYAEGGLKSRNHEPLNWFEIAGEDRQFFKATALIDGNKVVVSNPEVVKPVAVRFGWHHEAEPNLVNTEGFPASPFRTDDW